MHELRYALRVLWRSPGFAAIAILSLALGIGANTAIFSVSWVLFSQPLAVQNPDALMAIANRTPPDMRGMANINGSSYRDPASGVNYRAHLPYPAYRALRDAAGNDAEVFGYTFLREANIALEGWSTTGAAALASGNYFRGAGAAIVIGRDLTDEDDRPGTSAAVVSHRFWMSALGGDTAALGKSVRVNGVPFTIVGVSGPGFLGMSRGGGDFPPMDITIPLQAQPAVIPAWTRGGPSLFTSPVFWIHSMARVREGTPIAPLEAKLAATFAGWMKASGVPSFQEATDIEVRLLPGGRGLDRLSARAEQPMRILAAVVAIVLLLACVNVANAMLARGVAQAKEISVRLALGSGRLRLVRQKMIESFVLASVGAAIGLWIGVFGGRALLRMLTSSTGPIAMTLDINWRLLALTASIACIATVLSGVVPAIRLARRDLMPTMKSVVGVRGGRWRLQPATILMVAQVAISVPLVVGAAIFLQTVNNLERIDLGFNPERLVSFRLDPSLSGYDRPRIEQFYERILERVRGTAGVSSATLADEPPLAGNNSYTIATLPDGSKREVDFNRIGPEYFATLGVPVMAGRAVEARDRADAPGVIVINEAASTALFGSDSPLGRRLKLFNRFDVEVAGVVRDTKYDSLREAPDPTVFLPYMQTGLPLTLGPLYVVVRTAVAPASVTAVLRAIAADVDRDVPVSRMKTQTEQIQEALGTERALTRLLVAFGAFALLLACIGLHGLTAYAVARRTSEIGLRIALGAQRAAVVRLMLRQAVVVTVIGLAAGIALTVAGGTAVSSLLYGVKPIDVVSLAGAAVIISVVSGLAAYLPARKAARLEPLSALRSDRPS